MSTLLQKLQRRLFWLVARVCFALYRAFPVFGSLRASIALIHKDGKFLVIHRNDGRGVSLPGGIAARRESLEATLRREVHEETGLRVNSFELLMQYHSDADVPCDVSVFRALASGDVKGSWEGTPRWLTLAEIQPQLLPSQHATLHWMKQISSEAPRRYE